jgi:hypothetical protein
LSRRIRNKAGSEETRLDNINDWLEQQMMSLAATAAAKHAINLSWISVWAQPSASYRMYRSTSPEVPLEKAKLPATTSEPRFTHGALSPKQVVPVNAAGQDGQSVRDGVRDHPGAHRHRLQR